MLKDETVFDNRDSNTHMHDRSLSLLDIGTSLKRGGVKLDL
jgi:hypothetical protein